MKSFKKYYNVLSVNESPASDAYEIAVAKVINSWISDNGKAIRPKVPSTFPDVKVAKDGQDVWVEVKMNHTDPLAHPRFYYKDGKWNSNNKTPIGKTLVDILNSDKQSLQFISDLKEFLKNGNTTKEYKDLDKIYIPASAPGLKDPNAVAKEDMAAFLKTRPNKYVYHNSNINLNTLVRDHWENKGDPVGSAPVKYIQTGDDLFIINKNDNPLNIKGLPEFDASSCDLTIRVSIRTKFYETLATPKIKKIKKPSKYSFKPGSTKDLPIT